MRSDAEYLTAMLGVPSDESLRSQYAQWLVESGDPRGAYLLSELQWAASHDPADAATACEAAIGLDDVWVQRVSRPPLGVFLTRVRMAFPGPTLQPSHLEWFEQRFKSHLPADYQAFLLNYNGGWPEPAATASAARPAVSGKCQVAYFCHIPDAREPETDLDVDLSWRGKFLEQMRTDGFGYTEERNRWTNAPCCDWIIIGATPPMGDLDWICLGVRGDTLGQVHFAAPFLDEHIDVDHMPAAQTFAAFVEMLEACD
jgi:hypothetical protein